MSRLPRPVIPPPLPVERYEQQQPPVIVLNNPPAKPERPWSAFSVLAYVKAAILVLVFCGMAWGGWQAWRFVAAVQESFAESEREQSKMLTEARKFAAARLQKHGLAKIAKDAEFGALGNFATLSGLAADETGRLREFEIVWKVAKFDTETRWELQSLSIDGELVERIIGS